MKNNVQFRSTSNLQLKPEKSSLSKFSKVGVRSGFFELSKPQEKPLTAIESEKRTLSEMKEHFADSGKDLFILTTQGGKVNTSGQSPLLKVQERLNLRKNEQMNLGGLVLDYE